MKQKRYTDSQIVNILKESESGIIVSDLCRKYGISSSTFYKWREIQWYGCFNANKS